MTQSVGLLTGLVLILLCALFLCASRLYPKAESGHYRIEGWVPLSTQALKRLFHWAGWGCLVIGLALTSWFSVIID